MKPGFSKAFIISLFLNVLCVGILIGMICRPPFPMMGQPPFASAFNAMPDHGKSLMRETFMNMKKLDAEMRPQMMEIHDDLKKLVQTEPFDEQAFDVLRMRVRGVGQTTMDKGSENIKTLLKSLTLEERKVLVDSMMFNPPPLPFEHLPE